MKKIIILLIFLTGCASYKFSSFKKADEKLLKQIEVGMEKEEIEKICGKNYKIYKSETEMMEIWFYNNFYVGFDKEGKVIKFDFYEDLKNENKFIPNLNK
ncbi:MAG: hypothetical protein NC926_07345 [Candidatus Omnitrophica bacterium]|nr:hypothetical protein [Candidatus Omnitrophota bacterium]